MSQPSTARKRDEKRSQKSCAESLKPPLPYIPQDIIIHILSQLPVKPLLKFRCVNKSWFFLISSSEFIKLHLQVSSSNPNRHKLLLYEAQPHKPLYSCSVLSLLHKPPVIDRLKQPFYELRGGPWLVGSCNGVLLFRAKLRLLILWNPSTRKSRKLPFPGTDPCGLRVYGLGYNESMDDFKVVQICMAKKSKKYVWKVYSSRSNSWKLIEIDSPRFDSFIEPAVIVNGALHWISYRWNPQENIQDWFLPSFNVARETFVMLPLPKYERGCSKNIGVIKDCLGMSFYYVSIGKIDIWVMKEYGIDSSWMKLLSVANTKPIDLWRIPPMMFGSNDEKMVRSVDDLVKFVLPGRHVHALTYIESLARFT